MRATSPPLLPSLSLLLLLSSSSGRRGAESLRLFASPPPAPAAAAVRRTPPLIPALRRPRRRGAVVVPGCGSSSTTSHSSSWWSLELRSTTNDDDDDDDDELALSEIRRRLEEITQSLENARKREEDARLDNNLLRGRRDGTKVQTEDVVARLKRGFSDEIDVLSDRIEGAQDEMRDATARTRSLISGIREEAAERAAKLKSELSDLEMRLGSLRREAATASGARNRARRSVEDDVRRARSASTREIEGARSGLVEEKRRLKLERWEIESRIERALADAVPAAERLREAEQEERGRLPLISDLRDALAEATRGASSRIEELREGLKAREMFFDASFKRLREEKREEIYSARAISEGEIKDEDAKLDGAIAYYESLSTETEERLRRIVGASNEPVELSGYDAISEAQRKMEALIRERDDAISLEEEGRIGALKEAAESFAAVRDRYDAKYEDGLRDLEGQRSRSSRKLEQEDRRRESRMAQLRGEMEKLTLKLSTLMKDEREAAKLDYQELKKTKNAALAKSASQYEGTTDQIRSVRSDLIFAQDELNRLEDASRRNRLRVKELEDERSSFRKQVGRTMAIAIGRITRR